jgi:two-component system chemotaxis sensor kinase CheA
LEQYINVSQYTQTAVTQSGTMLTTLRIASEKVDTLMNLVSELISVQARLNNFSEQQKDTELETIVENINKVSRH